MQLPIEKLDRMGGVVLKAAAVIFLVYCFASCRTSQQISKKHLDKALSKDRGFVIGALREIAPCITVKKDTVTLPGELIPGKTDTILGEPIEISVPCPDSAGVKIVRKVTYTERSFLRVDTATKRIFITTRIKDMADSLYAVEVFKKKDAEIKKQSGKKNFWFVWSVITTLLLIFTLVGKYILKSLLPQPKL